MSAAAAAASCCCLPPPVSSTQSSSSKPAPIIDFYAPLTVVWNAPEPDWRANWKGGAPTSCRAGHRPDLDIKSVSQCEIQGQVHLQHAHLQACPKYVLMLLPASTARSAAPAPPASKVMPSTHYRNMHSGANAFCRDAQVNGVRSWGCVGAARPQRATYVKLQHCRRLKGMQDLWQRA